MPRIELENYLPSTYFKDYEDLRGLLEAIQVVLDESYDAIANWTQIFDHTTCPASFLTTFLEHVGFPLPVFDQTETFKRKLIGLAIEIYKSKGTVQGLISVVKLLLNIDITITENNVGDYWEVDIDELEIGTILHPTSDPDGWELFHFYINIPAGLTAEEQANIRLIADYMKPAHTHYDLLEPPSAPVAFWRVDESSLGVDTMLDQLVVPIVVGGWGP